ncbi:hypothetical protein LTS08_003735 [Lithohypha guttulata]|nr:hypothetical protein LTS08_003735 [Lithohypha guttulata]
MDQSTIPIPEIKASTGWSLLEAAYYYTGASLLRNLVWLMTGDGRNFDNVIWINTPGLGSGKVRCAVARPKGSRPHDQQFPVVLVLEGGGFILGQPEDGEINCRRIADTCQAIVVSIDYAKAPSYPFPHALLQIHSVLAWLFSPEAKQQGLSVDPERVAVMGNSAGGNLTASLSLLVSFTKGPCARLGRKLPQNFQLKYQIILYPGVDCHLLYRHRYSEADETTQKASIPIAFAELMEGAYLPPTIDKKQIFVAPTLADPALLRELKVPRALLLLAGRDCLVFEGQRFGANLKAAGIRTVVHEYPDAIHGFSHYKKGADFRPEDVENCWVRICDALSEAFRN